jgi:triacylglycerol lipase
MNIVLSHGILGFSHIGPINYFRDIAERFTGRGHKIIAPKVDPTRGVRFRGRQLREQIKDALAQGVLDPKAKSHIIAHSMGGLDSRYILSPKSPDRLESPIRSITTISTPHRGSPIADLLDPQHGSHVGDLLGDLARTAFSQFNISLDGLHDLTTDACREFNRLFTDDTAVDYFSVASSGRTDGIKTSLPLLPLHAYIASKTGQDVKNDGVVSVDSAHWGTVDPNTWPGDHVEAVGYNLDNLLVPPKFYLAKYDQILVNLEKL